MKGLIFVELLKMAEKASNEDLVDGVLDGLELESGGAYSAVGSYSCSELVAIVGGLSEKMNAPASALQEQFGHWMLDHFVENFGQFFSEKHSAFDMLESIDQEVHVEVRKLYPDAELPRFETKRLSQTEMTMTYISARPLQSFCHGLIESCLAHYGEAGQITIDDQSHNEATQVVFNISLDAA